jgi:hypothetical protein
MKNIPLTPLLITPKQKCALVFILLVASMVLFLPLRLKAQSPAPPFKKRSPVDVKKLTKQAQSGNVESEIQLAMDYDFGMNVERNTDEALRWYLKAADSGSS